MNCSRQINNTRGMNTKDTSNKKYCGICHKAGKPASDYESHYTKSVPGPTGIVTCPIILAASCNLCGQSGHFSDHCKNKNNRADKKNTDNHVVRVVSAPIRSEAIPMRRSENVFSALATFDDDNNDEVVMPVVKRPKISLEKEIASKAPNGISFAAMLLKPALSPAPPIEEFGFKICENLQNMLTSKKSDKLLLAEKIISQSNHKRCSWVDSDTDSDGDDDDLYNTAW